MRDLSYLLEEFTDNLDDAEVVALATTQDSDSERLTEDATKKRSICTRFPKHKNCEVCNRIKITRDSGRRPIGEALFRAEKFGFDDGRSQSPMRDVNQETNLLT